MNTVMAGIDSIKTLAYMDDLIVEGASLEAHNMALIKLFSRLRTHNIKVHPNKCEFLRTKMWNLGRTITVDRVESDKEKVQEISCTKFYEASSIADGLQRTSLRAMVKMFLCCN
jgi:hypothetical protein